MSGAAAGWPTDQEAPDAFARLYDWEHDPYTDDLAAYAALARRFGGPVLELACGTGRVLAALAEAGFACAGVDGSGAMLGRARQRLAPFGTRVQLWQQPVEALESPDGQRFRTILFPLDGLGLILDQAAQVEVLRRALTVATHDARLVVDVTNGNLRGGTEPVDELLHHLTAPDPATGRLITKWAVRRPDPAEQVDALTFFYDETDESGCLRRTTVDLRLRWFTRFELGLLLERAGWQVAELYGDYDLAPYGSGSDRLLMVATPAGAPSR